MAKYTAAIWANEYVLEANFSEASDTIVFDGEPTEFQVAHFGHDPVDALIEMLRGMAADGDAQRYTACDDVGDYRGMKDDELDDEICTAAAAACGMIRCERKNVCGGTR